MKIQIVICGWIKCGLNKAALAKFRARLHEIFSAYQPRQLSEDSESYDFLKHELTVQPNDLAVEKLLQRFDAEIKQGKLPVAATIHAYLANDEVKRARFLKLFFYGDSVDEDSQSKPLNPINHTLCAACKFPDTSVIPNPLFVSNKVLKKQDVFSTSTGMMVVRPHVIELLKQAIPSQFESGEVMVMPGKKIVASDEKLLWIRPKEIVGNELGKRFPKICPVCKRPLESRVFMFDDRIAQGGPGLYDERPRLENFGGGKADLALIDGYYGEIQPDGVPRWHWNLAISGALFTFLKKNGVKGIAAAAGSDPVKYFGSAQGGTLLEPIARTFTASGKNTLSKTGSTLGFEEEQNVLASIKHLPWDWDKAGFVYFYLTTPEIIILDPMTWEEDAGGPYVVKNYSKPGVYRLKTSAIKNAKGTKRGVAVDSATLLIIDNAYFAKLQDLYEWENAIKADGTIDPEYHNKIATKIGCRFAICTTPPSQFKSAFQGDGLYRIDLKDISRGCELI